MAAIESESHFQEDHHQGDQRDYPWEQHIQGEIGAPVGQVFIPIPGVKPELFNKKGKLVSHTNLRRASVWAKASRHELRRFEEVVKRNLKAKKSIRAIAVLGGILITVGVAGYELGPSHGRHVKQYFRWMKRGISELEQRARK